MKVTLLTYFNIYIYIYTYIYIYIYIHTTIQVNIEKSLEKQGSGWIIDSVVDPTISISKFNPLAGSRYINLPKELDHPRKGLINI